MAAPALAHLQLLLLLPAALLAQSRFPTFTSTVDSSERPSIAVFTLSLDQPAACVTVDGVTVRVRPASALSFVRSGGRWHPGSYQPTGKRPGAEGPIAEAAAGNPIFVYGTLGTRTAAELEERRDIARQAAAWSTARARVDFVPRLKAYAQVTDADLAASDLVLFGAGATNAVVAKPAGSFPLALEPGTADYGLLFIAPVGKHYALVSSGLPWWTGAGQANRGSYGFAAEPLALVATSGDYILFKGSLAHGSLAHVVVEGRFDRNWRVPPEAAASLSATGTITIR